MFILNLKFHLASIELSVSFTKLYPVSFDMQYLGHVTTQRRSPQCLCPIIRDTTNKLCIVKDHD